MDTTVCIVAGALVIILAILFVMWPRYVAKRLPPATGPIDNVVREGSRNVTAASIGMLLIVIPAMVLIFDWIIPEAGLFEEIIFGVVAAGILVVIFCRRD